MSIFKKNLTSVLDFLSYHRPKHRFHRYVIVIVISIIMIAYGNQTSNDSVKSIGCNLFSSILNTVIIDF